jgi:hypothetical protein
MLLTDVDSEHFGFTVMCPLFQRRTSSGSVKMWTSLTHDLVPTTAFRHTRVMFVFGWRYVPPKIAADTTTLQYQRHRTLLVFLHLHVVRTLLTIYERGAFSARDEVDRLLISQ